MSIYDSAIKVISFYRKTAQTDSYQHKNTILSKQNEKISNRPKKIQDIKNSIITTDAHFDKKTIAKFTSKTNPPKQQQKRQTSITNRRRLNNSYARETETGEFI